MRGIVLAGGAGTRLHPITRVASKQLQPVYDKPMIYYPLSTLMLGGIREILLISTPQDLPRFRDLLGDGSQWGLSLTYREQPRPGGLAQAFILGEDFIAGEPVALILGDNIFYGNMRILEIVRSFTAGALIFGYYVQEPSRYGVVEFDKESGRVLGIEEKPANPKSHFAVPGLYLYDGKVSEMARKLAPSSRGELEITDLNMAYLQLEELQCRMLGRGIAWLDTGTHASLLEAANFIFTLQQRQGLQIGCLEEVALHMGYVRRDRMAHHVSEMPSCDYRSYLERRLLDFN